MPQMIQNLIRLNASSYHCRSFFKEEESMANSFGLKYTFIQSQEDLSLLRQLCEKGNSIFISNTHTTPEILGTEMLNSASLWLHSNSGYDNFSYDFVSQAKFPIITGNSIRSSAVTEYILAQLFEKFGLCLHQATWDTSRSWPRPLLKEKNVLICGEGLIGSTLESTLGPLCNELAVYDPFKKSEQEFKLTTFLKKLPQIDIVLMACSLNSTSRHLINPEVLKLLARDFVLINAARGELVDERGLLDHLRSEPKACAVLDVFESEPTPKNSIDLKNLKRSSHIAGVSKSLDKMIISFEKEAISLFLNDETAFTKMYKDQSLASRMNIKMKELI